MIDGLRILITSNTQASEINSSFSITVTIELESDVLFSVLAIDSIDGNIDSLFSLSTSGKTIIINNIAFELAQSDPFIYIFSVNKGIVSLSNFHFIRVKDHTKELTK